MVYRLNTLRRRNEAIVVFQKANDSAPEDLDILQHLVSCLVQELRFEEALNFARQATQVAPNSALAWADLAMLLFKIGDPREAKNASDRAVDLDPDRLIYRLIEGKVDSILE